MSPLVALLFFAADTRIGSIDFYGPAPGSRSSAAIPITQSLFIGFDEPGATPVTFNPPPKGNAWVVLDGLKAGEQVMVEGFQKLQMAPPGTPVKAVPWKAPSPEAAAAATGGVMPAPAASAASGPAAAAPSSLPPAASAAPASAAK